jgi:ribosomal protein S18 acetylase RimI-like enzyme
MANIPNAAYMDRKDGKELLKKGSAYFIHRNGELLGIGVAAGDFIDTVIAVKPGAGETVVQALASVLTEDTVRLWVASANERAIRLYERMGFTKVKELSKWHLVFG